MSTISVVQAVKIPTEGELEHLNGGDKTYTRPWPALLSEQIDFYGCFASDTHAGTIFFYGFCKEKKENELISRIIIGSKM